MSDLLKEAIADAKAVRETALANAKMALEEAFTPQLKNMLSAKLREDEFEDEEEFGDEEGGGEEEIPAEEGDYGMGEDEFGGEDELEVDESKIIEINGVKYAPIVSEDDEEEFGGEDELDLEAIIRELETEINEEDDAYDESGDKSDKNDGIASSELAEHDDAYDENVEGKKDSQHVGDENTGVGGTPSIKSEGEEEDDEDLEIDESIFTEDDDDDDDDDDEKEVEESTKISPVQAELDEYKKAVRFLKDKLHEVNILNAKLLFTNKLFKEFALDNNQKLKVVETFDRTQSTREIKLVYTTLAEQFSDNGSINKKHSIKESASAKSGSTKPSKESRKVISEEAQVANRFKKLAGIING